MIDTFLTAYDPSDLPGTSIDPLGFERGYLFLADKILPGLTNVASRPRYFAMICAGIQLSGGGTDGTPREVYRRRQEMVLRLERFWALANVLARPGASGGVRGVTYAEDRADKIHKNSSKRTDSKYKLLSRQPQYGAIGMYASVADGMRFLNRDDFTLSPALGEVAANAFREETDLPPVLRRAIVEDGEVPVGILTSWGERAHVEGEINQAEGRCLFDAVHSNPVRSAMITCLMDHPFVDEQESELHRLSRVSAVMKNKDQNRELSEAIDCIFHFEACYKLVNLALERMLWLCRSHPSASITINELDRDFVLQLVRDRLPTQTNRFISTLSDGVEPNFRKDLDRLHDVQKFLSEIGDSVGNPTLFCESLIDRHGDIQRGKFDRGRRKMPWIERHDSRVTLTMARAGGANREITDPEQVWAHPYRLRAADAFICGSRKADA